jgi:zinc transport system ATP-binding protein
VSHLLDIRNLGFSYDGRPVLQDINLAVDEGTTLGLIGPNGGGKTTLLTLILGLHKPQQGLIELAGLPPERAVATGRIVGYVPQRSGVTMSFPISVRQYVHLGLAGKTGFLRTYNRDDCAYADRLIERIGLGELRDTPIGRLSGGQFQRAMIARAVASRPKLMLLDEPTLGVDRRGQQEFIELLIQLRSELALTIILVSHDLRAVASLSDRIACLSQTIHYHDVPHQIPADLMMRMFACDLAALGLATSCHDPACQGHHLHTPTGAA